MRQVAAAGLEEDVEFMPICAALTPLARAFP
jgi:hypothetical protein